MWVLPSRGRPHNLARLAAAWHATGADTPLWLRLDHDDPMFVACLALAIPAAWRRDVGPRLPLSYIYNEAYRRAPDRPWYGFIADDVVPETPKWDARLIEAAGPGGMAVPAGGHDPGGTPHFVLGGDLVRSVGWLALPGLDRLHIDEVWADIAAERDRLRRIPDVVLRHRHFSNGLALRDKTYRKTRRAEDRAIYEAWRSTR